MFASGNLGYTPPAPDPGDSGDVYLVANEAAMLALAATKGDKAKRADTGEVYQLVTDDPTQAENWVAVSDLTPAWAAIPDKPTTLAGYGITDAASITLGNVNPATGRAALGLGTADSPSLNGLSVTGVFGLRTEHNGWFGGVNTGGLTVGAFPSPSEPFTEEYFSVGSFGATANAMTVTGLFASFGGVVPGVFSTEEGSGVGNDGQVLYPILFPENVYDTGRAELLWKRNGVVQGAMTLASPTLSGFADASTAAELAIPLLGSAPSYTGGARIFYRSDTQRTYHTNNTGGPVEFVSISASQTLSNKTLSSPTITGTTTSSGMIQSTVVPNSLTGVASIQASSVSPMFELWETDGGTDGKRWDWYANGGVMNFRAKSDDGATSSSVLSVSRSGAASTTATFGAKVVAASALNLGAQTSDVGASPGDMWYRSDTNDLRVRVGTSNYSVVNTSQAQTISNKTLSAPVLSGTVTGTYTLGGTPTISSPTISGTPVFSDQAASRGALGLGAWSTTDISRLDTIAGLSTANALYALDGSGNPHALPLTDIDIQFQSGTDAERLTVTPAMGVPVWTTDTKRLYVGDDSTAGGVPVGAPELPSQTGHAGKVLTTDGTAVSWEASSASSLVTVADYAARHALTSSDVSIGDVVQVSSDGRLYLVANLSELDSAQGYAPLARWMSGPFGTRMGLVLDGSYASETLENRPQIELGGSEGYGGMEAAVVIDGFPVVRMVDVPATPTSSGRVGDIASDGAGGLYVFSDGYPSGKWWKFTGTDSW